MNGPALPALLMASAAAGVRFSPLNYRLSAEDLDQLLGRLDHPFIVADEAAGPAMRRPGQVMTTAAWFDAARTPSPAAAAGPAAPADDDCAVLLFTSGTTGRPKGVVLRHENLVSYVIGTVEFGSADPDEAVLVSVPPYHVAAVGSALTNLYAWPPDGLPPQLRPGRLARARHAGTGHPGRAGCRGRLYYRRGRYGPGAAPNCSRSGPRRILPTGVRISAAVNSYDRGHLNPARCSRQ
jgi:AMP-binding enzyme